MKYANKEGEENDEHDDIATADHHDMHQSRVFERLLELRIKIIFLPKYYPSEDIMTNAWENL
jgi:hypothetical protein